MRRQDFARTEQRRRQILDAAFLCFRRSGFRGASMADISAAAGLSIGHIYHYFDGKEAIVETIAERWQTVSRSCCRPLRAGEDVVRAIVTIAPESFLERDDAGVAVLLLECFAEASRNPTVGRIFETCDRAFLAEIQKILRAGKDGGALGEYVDVDEMAATIKIIIYGLVVQMATNALIRSAEIQRILSFSIMNIAEYYKGRALSDGPPATGPS